MEQLRCRQKIVGSRQKVSDADFCGAVALQAMRPSLSGAGSSREIPRLGETIHIPGQPLSRGSGGLSVRTNGFPLACFPKGTDFRKARPP